MNGPPVLLQQIHLLAFPGCYGLRPRSATGNRSAEPAFKFGGFAGLSRKVIGSFFSRRRMLRVKLDRSVLNPLRSLELCLKHLSIDVADFLGSFPVDKTRFDDQTKKFLAVEQANHYEV